MEVSYVLSGTVSGTYDANKSIYVRDFFYIPKPIVGYISSNGGDGAFTAQYTEQLFSFAAADEFTVSFSGIVWNTGDAITNAFTSNPIVTAEVYPSGSDTDNVNVYIKSISTTGAVFGTSAPFSGTLRVSAIYSPGYPTVVKRYPLVPSNIVTASANATSAAGLENLPLVWPALPGKPSIFRINPGINSLSDVYIETGSFTAGNTDVALSSDFNDVIYYIAITGSV